MEHLTEFAIIVTNILLTVVSLGLAIVTALANDSLRQVALAALKSRKIVRKGHGKHEA